LRYFILLLTLLVGGYLPILLLWEEIIKLNLIVVYAIYQYVTLRFDIMT